MSFFISKSRNVPVENSKAADIATGTISVEL